MGAIGYLETSDVNQKAEGSNGTLESAILAAHECKSDYANPQCVRHRCELRVFEKWGWKKCWDWGTPPTFGSVGSGECEIFLCQDGQGGRGRGENVATFGPNGDQTADKGAWMSVWVEDVDAVHKQCVGAGLDVTFPPTNMPWNVREMHLRHPDGHVFRISKGVGE